MYSLAFFLLCLLSFELVLSVCLSSFVLSTVPSSSILVDNLLSTPLLDEAAFFWYLPLLLPIIFYISSFMFFPDHSVICLFIQMPINTLAEVNRSSKYWTVHVYVSHLWHRRGGTDNEPIKHNDMVLIDKQVGHPAW